MTEQVTHEKPSPVSIRIASKTDLPTIEGILKKTVQNPYGSGNIDEGEVKMELERINKALDLKEEDQVLIAENKEGETLGFALFGRPDSRILDFTQSNPVATLELKLLYLNPTQRNKRIGSQLLDAVEQAVKNKGISKIELTSGPRYTMIGSGRFYEKRGYRCIGTIPNYFEGTYSAKVYQKNLQ